MPSWFHRTTDKELMRDCWHICPGVVKYAPRACVVSGFRLLGFGVLGLWLLTVGFRLLAFGFGF